MIILAAGMVFLSHPLHAQTAAVGSFSGDIMRVQPVQNDSIVSAVAEAQGLQLVPPDQVPLCGTFWTVLPGPGGGVGLPFPCPPLDPSLPVYAIADGQFLVDGTIGGQAILNTPQAGRLAASSMSAAALEAQANAVLNLITQVQTVAANRQMRTMARAMAMDASSPGDGGGDGGSDNYSNFASSYTIDTNGLWLTLTNVSGGLAYLNLHGATGEVYEIFSRVDLANGGWNIEQELWPTDTNSMPFTIPVLNRTDALFIWARDWTGVTSGGNETPEWWFWEYFGTVALSDTNLDGNGSLLLSDYTNGVVPAAFQFTAIETTNNYFNTGQAPAQLDVSGYPYYLAVSVDDTNYAADANWQGYTGSNITVNLGFEEGWHDVWIGLRGHADASTAAVWQWKRLKLDLTPPLLVVTNPVVGVVSVPMIQLQGYSPESLDSISYDLTNATGLVTNQQVLVLNQIYDTNTREFTTNTFQAFDLPLTNGLNVITLHATDLAGNVTTTNFSFTLDYSSKTNPPIIQLYWPGNGEQISGSNFTWRGRVDDPTATVTAQMVGTNGITNIVSGLVERNGNFWVEKLPMSNGTNSLTLTVTDAAGNTSVTNITVSPNPLTVTMAPIPDDQLWQPAVTASGTISDSTFSLWINGVKATVANGAWTATNVPMTPGGTAVFNITTYAPNEQQPDGSYGNGQGGN